MRIIAPAKRTKGEDDRRDCGDRPLARVDRTAFAAAAFISRAANGVGPSTYVATMNWGSVAEWVGAVGTIGALLLGIGLFARERAILRRKSVDELVTWLTWREVPDRELGVRLETTVHISNRGSRAVHAPLLFYPDQRGGYGSEILSSDGAPTMLAPALRCDTSCRANRGTRLPDT